MIKTRFTVIFGLTADPFHKGHEQAIINGIEYCRYNGIEIEQFLLIPVYQPNLITDKKAPVAPFEHRFSMCKLVAERLSKQLDCDIQVSQIEKELVDNSSEKNYSYNTIRALKEWIPAFAGMTERAEKKTEVVERSTKDDGDCLFMVSADHFQGRWPKFRKWYKWSELLEHSGLLINQRPGNRINHNFIAKLRKVNPDVFVVQNSDIVDISSTEIRRGFDAEQVVGLLSPDILDYIKDQGLY